MIYSQESKEDDTKVLPNSDDDDFQASDEEEDDEQTLLEQEKEEKDVDHDQEMQDLEAESKYKMPYFDVFAFKKLSKILVNAKTLKKIT